MRKSILIIVNLLAFNSFSHAGERHLQSRFCEINIVYFGEVSAASLFCNADDFALKKQWRVLEDAGCSASKADMKYFMLRGFKQFYAEEKAKGKFAVCGR